MSSLTPPERHVRLQMAQGNAVVNGLKLAHDEGLAVTNESRMLV